MDHVIPHRGKHGSRSDAPGGLGGPTCACNLQPLCRHHHRMKHESAWTVARWNDGSRTWTAPTGHTYALGPPTALSAPRARRTPGREAVRHPVHVSRFDSAERCVAALRHAVQAPHEPQTSALQTSEPQMSESPDPGPPPF